MTITAIEASLLATDDGVTETVDESKAEFLSI